ncbi:T. brucei spp.-specific protein [Trypanosoma brucei gambiense DAL972]|uniref:T. brucei spp.-specific protein n=1 Tax=Trypanosoma brucei gambiense (strain MHOM/CI/86/DAL972) TaxID=679716 RepID=D0AA20_TRYB9|nr:T. brucei spp.-specific protein [Trypanosoma brucei gambiense DAL972]CBH18521.1 T. brucei spp.-specific protein [Trypanosoma brucei gambiense DAL972]|eukprot:XP_011780785.1 T. brucei spp.-specific protein [Trypanosoma brucei gambiense DAL972]
MQTSSLKDECDYQTCPLGCGARKSALGKKKEGRLLLCGASKCPMPRINLDACGVMNNPSNVLKWKDSRFFFPTTDVRDVFTPLIVSSASQLPSRVSDMIANVTSFHSHFNETRSKFISRTHDTLLVTTGRDSAFNNHACTSYLLCS